MRERGMGRGREIGGVIDEDNSIVLFLTSAAMDMGIYFDLFYFWSKKIVGKVIFHKLEVNEHC